MRPTYFFDSFLFDLIILECPTNYDAPHYFIISEILSRMQSKISITLL
jgi:hypothetical protein